jgi:hypothetical protein
MIIIIKVLFFVKEKFCGIMEVAGMTGLEILRDDVKKCGDMPLVALHVD